MAVFRKGGRAGWMGVCRSVLVVAALATQGCVLTEFHRSRADSRVYAIIESVEKDILGKTSDFKIDTKYSARNPNGVSAQEILDDRSRFKTETLTLDKAIDVAVAQNRNYQSQKESLYIAALNLTGAKHEFQPRLFAESTARGTHAVDDERSGTVASRLGITQRLISGADLSVRIANDLFRFYTGDPRRSAVSAISVNALQPLLRGAGRQIAAENLKQSHRNVIYAVRDYSDFQNRFAVDIVLQYFRLLQQRDTVYNEYSNYKSRQGTTEYLRARSVDRVPPLEVAQAEQGELAAKNRYIDAVVALRNSLDDFKIVLGLPLTTDLRLDPAEIEELRKSGLKTLYLDSDQAFTIALKHRLPMMNEIDRFEDARRQVSVAADALKPGLDIFADASLDSEGTTNYEDFDFEKVRANAGVVLDLPIDRLQERNRYRAALIEFEEQLRSLSRTFDETRSTIDQGLRGLQRFRQNHAIQKNAVALAERRVEGARLNLQAGNAVVRDLEEAQDALIAAQNALTNALVDYLSARLNLLVELGVLNAEEKRFWLKDTASTIDFSKQPANWLPEAFLQGDKVIPPEELFPEEPTQQPGD